MMLAGLGVLGFVAERKKKWPVSVDALIH